MSLDAPVASVSLTAPEIVVGGLAIVGLVAAARWGYNKLFHNGR
ncbi:MAG: hypothetical protein AAB489_00085 [Patescibacteria group bacterium]